MSVSLAQQQKVLARILKARGSTSLFRQLGLQRLSSFKDFEALYTGFARAVPVMGAKVFVESLGKMLPQGSSQALEILQSGNLLVKGRPVAACAWRGAYVPVGKEGLGDHVRVEGHLRKLLHSQGVEMPGGMVFYLHEQEGAPRSDTAAQQAALPVRGWHEMLEPLRWFWQREKFRPMAAGLPQTSSRMAWFNAMSDEMRVHGPKVDVLVTHPKTLIDYGLYVSQQAGRYVPLRELLPNLKVLALNHYEIGLQRTELSFLLAGLNQLRWVQWLYNPTGMQMWQGDINIRQRLEVLLDGEVFYEFIPTEDIDAQGRFARGYRRVHVGMLELGGEYAVVVNNLDGLLGVSTGMVVRVVSTDPLQVIARGPILRLNGLGEGLREDIVVDTLGNINSALVGHGVFVREALLGHHVSERLPVWVMEVSRPLNELAPGILESIARRVHAEFDMRCDDYRKAYRGAAFKAPKVHFVPMGTFAAAFTGTPEFGQFDHSPDAALVKKVIAAAWDVRAVEGA